MPIYSRNRTGVMETTQIAPDKSYGVNDFGRILYETQQNDMAFFESILATDFNEVKGLNEGTILESEIAALNEASKNEIMKKIKEKGKELIAKIKGIIENAIENIANYTAVKYAELVNKFAAIPADKLNNWNGKITIRTFNYNNDVFRMHVFSYNTCKTFETAGEICSHFLYNNVYGNTNGTLSASEFNKLALEKCTSEVTYDKSNIKDLKDSLKSGRNMIKYLKSLEKGIIATTNDLYKSISDDLNNDEDSINEFMNVINGCDTYNICVIRANIAAVRNDMKSRATGMVKAIASINKTPKDLQEAYILEAAEDFEEIMNGEFNQGLIDDEARTNIENLMKAAEED